MRIAQLLSGKGAFVATVTPDTTVRDLVAALAEHRVGALVVSSDGSTIEGIVSERDVVRAMHQRGADLLIAPVSEIMTTSVSCTTADAGVDNLMLMMTEQRIRHVPVVDEENQLAGIISIGDVVKAVIADQQRTIQQLSSYIAGDISA